MDNFRYSLLPLSSLLCIHLGLPDLFFTWFLSSYTVSMLSSLFYWCIITYSVYSSCTLCIINTMLSWYNISTSLLTHFIFNCSLTLFLILYSTLIPSSLGLFNFILIIPFDSSLFLSILLIYIVIILLHLIRQSHAYHI